MKKIIYVLLFMLTLVSLTSCATDEIDLENVVFESTKVQYDGNEHSIYVTGLPEGVTVLYIGNNVSEVGVHTVKAELYDSEEKLLKTLTATITITQVVPEELKGITFDSETFDCDGSAHSIYVQNLPEGFTVAYSGNKVNEPGVYTVTAKIYNSELKNVLTLTATITIVSQSNNDSGHVELPLV